MLGRRHVPTLVTLHGVPDGDYSAAARVLRRCCRSCRCGVRRRRRPARRGGLPAALAWTWSRTPSRPLRRHDRTEARARLDLSPDVPVAVCVARLVDQKRHDLLVTAWRSLPRRRGAADRGRRAQRRADRGAGEGRPAHPAARSARRTSTCCCRPPTSACCRRTGRACRSRSSRRWPQAFRSWRRRSGALPDRLGAPRASSSPDRPRPWRTESRAFSRTRVTEIT